MKALWSLFWRVVAMRQGPEDVPFSRELMLLAIAASLGLGLASRLAVSPTLWLSLLGVAALTVALEVLMLSSLLAFKGLGNRFVQSLTAIYGAETLLGLLGLPLIALYLAAGPESPLLGIGFLLELLLLGWSLGVRGFIYHRALNVSIFQGNMLSMALFFITLFSSMQLFPELLKSS